MNPSLPTPRILPSEWKFVAAVAAALLLLTSLPYAFASASAPAEKQFMGFILNISDHTQYLSWYKAYETNLLTSDRQTSEDNPAVFFNLLWLALARFGRFTGLGYAVVYQIFRWLAGGFFLAMVYAFGALIFPAIAQRRAVFLFVALGSGIGWLEIVAKYALRLTDLTYPLGVYLAEGNTFLCLLGYPHFLEAAGLILAVFALLLLGERRGQLRYAVFAGLTAHFLGWQHGYDLIIVWLIPTAYGGVLWLVKRRWPDYWFKAMLTVGLLSWPPALYSVLLTRLNPIWEEVLAQFANAGVYSPWPLLMFVPMGLLLALALAGFIALARQLRRNPPENSPQINHPLFLLVWLVAGWVLAYIPTDYQIHMINSWQIPIALLAVYWVFEHLAPRLSTLNVKRLTLNVLIVITILPTNLYLFAWRFVELARYSTPYFLYRDEVAALEWLESETPVDSVIFSSYDFGQFIPGLSGRIAFLSHWAQTLDFFHKRDLAAAFFDPSTSEAARQQILVKYDIDYVFYGASERALGAYDPENTPYLELVFDASQASIYEFVK